MSRGKYNSNVIRNCFRFVNLSAKAYSHIALAHALDLAGLKGAEPTATGRLRFCIARTLSGLMLAQKA